MSDPTSRSRPALEMPVAARPAICWEGGGISVGRLLHRSGERPEHELVLWVEAETERVLAARFVAPAELPAAAVALLRQAMEQPLTGPPRRPAEVRVREAALAAALREGVGGLGVRVAVADECPAWSAVVREFGAFLAAHWPGRSYFAGEDVTPRLLERFFEAAASFYRRAPWQVLDEEPIELRVAEHDEPLYAVVLGRGRLVHGLTLYYSGAALADHVPPDAHPVRTRDTVAVTFDREDTTPPPMLAERRAHRWPLAGPAAIPLPYRRLADGTMCEPSAADLELLTLALRVVAEFSARCAAAPARRPIVEAVQVPDGTGGSIARLTFPAQLPADGGAEPPERG